MMTLQFILGEIINIIWRFNLLTKTTRATKFGYLFRGAIVARIIILIHLYYFCPRFYFEKFRKSATIF